MVVDKLRQGQYDAIDRCYCGKTIFDYTWHIFPIIRDHHFTLIVIHMKTNSNDIMYFDFYHSTCLDDITAVHGYCRHTEQRLNLGTSQHWNIQPSAGHIRERQVDTVSCGVYCMMIPDCLTHGINIRLLTPTSVIKCRRRIAQALLKNFCRTSE